MLRGKPICKAVLRAICERAMTAGDSLETTRDTASRVATAPLKRRRDLCRIAVHCLQRDNAP